MDIIEDLTGSALHENISFHYYKHISTPVVALKVPKRADLGVLLSTKGKCAHGYSIHSTPARFPDGPGPSGPRMPLSPGGVRSQSSQDVLADLQNFVR